MVSHNAEVGVFGGSGFYSFIDVDEEVEVSTPFGKPSDLVSIAVVGGRRVAFIPRHGRHHSIPPHLINYRANVWALKSLGVSQVIGFSAVGSLNPLMKPGDFVLCNQLVDRTWGRNDSFFEGNPVVHVSLAEPFCPVIRREAVFVCKKLGIPVHESGTVVVIQGPRFSTRAESQWFSKNGWDLVNMTQYPEAVLAREQEMCYASVSLVTDFDAGLEGNPEIKAVEAKDIQRVLSQNAGNSKKMILELIPRLPKERKCVCASALKNAGL